MIKPLAFFVSFLLAASGCAENDSIQPENFVGKWIVTNVDNDGVVRTEWVGTHLTIEQNRADSGTYSMYDTKYDTIWSTNGHWTKSSEPETLLLDDTLMADFTIQSERLIISRYLPWTARSTCDNEICLPVVTGSWVFEFESDK